MTIFTKSLISLALAFHIGDLIEFEDCHGRVYSVYLVNGVRSVAIQCSDNSYLMVQEKELIKAQELEKSQSGDAY